MGSFSWPLTQWLSIAVSQILAVTYTQSILYTAHSLEDYNLRRVLDGFQDTAEGHIVAVTSQLLVRCEFAPGRVRATAIPLRAVESLDITRITEVRGPSGVWPDRLEFEVKAAGEVFTFPPSRASNYQGLPAVLDAVRAAMVRA
ncbi:hypothetical protein [Pseudarthrobacter sp. PH31-O2]|uniref:hypothetical protein n=1 Tax=Pseudarthrobacter sp. PH31-O2 TaxID=3046206 RepID=UPI0024BAF073|nr:hypothetical protein [Pseudarthrobacter sp. PH31-O2]MDJ0353379.1 hypothetical protein [Pseudarthrobacter sp. PH31-O2]